MNEIIARRLSERKGRCWLQRLTIDLIRNEKLIKPLIIVFKVSAMSDLGDEEERLLYL